MTLEQGSILHNRYRIVEVLGQGGMGAVYHAIDENLSVDVAVKENLYLTAEYSQQFKREATILASLRHTNLPRVSDHFTIEGQGQYLVMDFIAGEDLRQRMERIGHLTEEDAVLIGAAVCEALDYLHTRPSPIIHRDIKPGNIKITPDGEIVLVDFGLAKVIQSSQNTATGARAMTPGYSPPEQYGTAHTDARSDVYSLAATLYSSLSGVIPEDGLARATGSVDLTPLRTRLPKISRRVAAVIEKGLAIQPHERYQSAREFRAALLDSLAATRGLTADARISPAPNEEDSAPAQVIQGELVSDPSAGSAALARPSQVSYTRPVEPWTSGSNWLAMALLVFLLASGAWILFNPERGTAVPPTPAVVPSITPCAGDGCLALSGYQVSSSTQPTPTTALV
ncbi:MAG TPA: serine/threonine-protein kinase, partial [Anaerolineaceae bacterium]|nr:serine/threonine-protein kinase [Anaerolineaceae bacterium]